MENKSTELAHNPQKPQLNISAVGGSAVFPLAFLTDADKLFMKEVENQRTLVVGVCQMQLN